MYPLIHIFNRAMVQRFYKDHLVPFLFFLLIMFGVADGNTILHFHYYLLISAFSSPVGLLCLCAFWLLYSLNGLRYVFKTLNQNEYQFIFISNSARRAQLVTALATAVVQIDLPIILYALIGIVIGISQAFYSIVLLAVLLLIVLLGVQILMLYRRFVYIYFGSATIQRLNVPGVHWKPSLFSVILRNTLQHNKVAFTITKIFSCLVIYGAHYEWNSYNYDIRWMQIALALSIPAHGVLMQQIWNFETSRLGFTRNFAIKLFARYRNIFFMVALLMVPETVLLFSYCFQYHVLWQFPLYILYIAGLPMLLYTLLFIPDFDEDSYSSFLFAVGLITFFVSLFGFNWLLSLAFIIISIVIFCSSFYEYDKPVE